MMTDKDDILLNSREVAFLLDLSPDTVNEFARRNILPAFKKGRQWRFRKRDIASFKRHMRGVNVGGVTRRIVKAAGQGGLNAVRLARVLLNSSEAIPEVT